MYMYMCIRIYEYRLYLQEQGNQLRPTTTVPAVRCRKALHSKREMRKPKSRAQHFQPRESSCPVGTTRPTGRTLNFRGFVM